MTSNKPGPPRPTVRALELDGTINLYDSASQQAAVLNGSASDIWRLMDGERTVEEIVAVLAAAYRVDPDTIRPQVAHAVVDLAGFLASP